MFRFAVCATILFTCAAPVSAWTTAGHMVTGAIAYDVLKKDDPVALEAALKLLKGHPSHEKLWKAQLEKLPAEDRDQALFMLAARWSDDIRRDPAFDRPTWHYVTNAFTPPGQKPGGPIPPTPAVNAVSAYNENRTRLTTAIDPVDRSLALTWIFHLVGDIHQPMHTTSLYTADYPQPDGDRGGNRFWIKVTPDSKAINLHFFWDGVVTNTEDTRDAKKIATELRLRPEFASDKLTELKEPKFETWANPESFELAKSVVYRNGKLAGGTAEFTAAVLPDGYAKEAKAVGERRTVLAGYRIAAVLKDAIAYKPGREE